MNMVKAVLCFLMIAHFLPLHAISGFSSAMPLLKAVKPGQGAAIIAASIGASVLWNMSIFYSIDRFFPEFFLADSRRHYGRDQHGFKVTANGFKVTAKRREYEVHYCLQNNEYKYSIKTGWYVGILLALAARIGSAPKLDAVDFVKPGSVALAATGLATIGFGLLGWWRTRNVDATVLRELFKKTNRTMLQYLSVREEDLPDFSDIPDDSLKRYLVAGTMYNIANIWFSFIGIMGWTLYNRWVAS